EPPVVMTLAMFVFGSTVHPTATTCGELSERSVVNMAKCRSVRNASASFVILVVAFAINLHGSAGNNHSREGHGCGADRDFRWPQRNRAGVGHPAGVGRDRVAAG